jgi:hypothetical protein
MYSPHSALFDRCGSMGCPSSPKVLLRGAQETEHCRSASRHDEQGSEHDRMAAAQTNP